MRWSVAKETDEIKEWRKKIDEIDIQLVRLLNERARCAEKIGSIKMKLGAEVYSPEREKQVMDNVTRHNQGPLSNAALCRLFERIVDESRILERSLGEKTERNK